MKVVVVYEGMLRTIAGRRSESVELPGDTLRDLALYLRESRDALKQYIAGEGRPSGLYFCVKGGIASPETPLRDGDEVAIVPVIIGG